MPPPPSRKGVVMGGNRARKGPEVPERREELSARRESTVASAVILILSIGQWPTLMECLLYDDGHLSSCCTHTTVCLFIPTLQSGETEATEEECHRAGGSVPQFPRQEWKESGKEVSLLTCAWPAAPVATRWSEEAYGDLAMVVCSTQEPARAPWKHPCG